MPIGYHRSWHSAVIASPPVEQLGVTGRGTSNLLDVRLDRAAAQDDPHERRLGRLAQADPLGQPSAPQQMGLPGRGRLPRAAGPAKGNDQRLILRPHAFARCPACLEAAGILLANASAATITATAAAPCPGIQSAQPGRRGQDPAIAVLLPVRDSPACCLDR